MPKIIFRAEAKRAGLLKYFTGKPCPRGHLAPRFVGNTHCQKCDRDRAREYYRNNSERLRTAKTFRVRGISPVVFEEMRQNCNDQCSICKCHKPQGRGAWHIDHDHDTGKVRGLLCSNCNTALGLVRDSIPVLKGMIAYLEEHSASNAAGENQIQIKHKVIDERYFHG